MVPSQLIFERTMILLGQDSVTLSQTTDVLKVALIQAPFVPSQSLVVGGVVLATFDGSTPKDVDAGDLPESLDPQNGDALLDFRPDVGGFLWEVTGVTALPQTIYGWCILKNDLSVLYAADLLPEPVALTAVNQSITLPRLTLRLPNASIL